MAQEIAHAAGIFFAREYNDQSLITVTRAELTPDFKEVRVFFSVLPVSREKVALAFAKRARSDFREFLKERSALSRIPTVDFEIDWGEKNRQRVDELTRS